MAIGTLPPELFAEQQQLNRQQQMAQLLMQQGQQQPQGQMVSGRYVAPSFFQYAAPLAQMYAGTRMAEKGDKQALELASKLRQRQTDDLTQYQNLMNPKPTLAPEQAGPTQMGQPIPREMVQGVPDRQAANLFAASSYNPALQAVGMKNLTQGPKWEKASFTDEKTGKTREGVIDTNSPDPISTFQVGGVKPEMSAYERASLQFKAGDQAISRANLLYNTGMNVGGGGMPTGAPANAPMNMPMGGTPIQTSGGGMPTQAPFIAGGSGMSPAAVNEANKQIFVDVEKRRIENLEKSPQVLATMTDTLRNIDDLIGDARVIKDPKTKKDKIDYTVTQDGKQVQGRKPLAGFELAVGAGIPSWMPFQGGTDVQDFRIRLDQIKDKTFLQAFESLKGAGQITEKEGEKATSALNRMNTAQSEVEFIKAAREFEENVRTGMELAKRKTGMPTSSATSPRLRWNPSTNSWQ
jgi:hypothetical protein